PAGTGARETSTPSSRVTRVPDRTQPLVARWFDELRPWSGWTGLSSVPTWNTLITSYNSPHIAARTVAWGSNSRDDIFLRDGLLGPGHLRLSTRRGEPLSMPPGLWSPSNGPWISTAPDVARR